MKKSKEKLKDRAKKHSNYMKKYRHTPNGFYHCRWLAIQRRCINGKYTSELDSGDGGYVQRGTRCTMKRADFKKWCLEEAQVRALNNILSSGKTPALAMIDPTKNVYALNNIMITTTEYTNKIGHTNSILSRQKEYSYNGIKATVQEHMDRVGIKESRRYIMDRLRNGWDFERAITEPKKVK